MKRFKYHENSSANDLGRMALKVVCAKEGIFMTKARYYTKVRRQAQFAYFKGKGKAKMNMDSLRRAISPAVVNAIRSFKRNQGK